MKKKLIRFFIVYLHIFVFKSFNKTIFLLYLSHSHTTTAYSASEKTYYCHYFGQHSPHKSTFFVTVICIKSRIFSIKAICPAPLCYSSPFHHGNVDRAFTQSGITLCVCVVYTTYFYTFFSSERYASVSSLRPRHNYLYLWYMRRKGLFCDPAIDKHTTRGLSELCFYIFGCVYSARVILLSEGWTMTYQRVGSSSIEIPYSVVYHFFCLVSGFALM